MFSIKSYCFLSVNITAAQETQQFDTVGQDVASLLEGGRRGVFMKLNETPLTSPTSSSSRRIPFLTLTIKFFTTKCSVVSFQSLQRFQVMFCRPPEVIWQRPEGLQNDCSPQVFHCDLSTRENKCSRTSKILLKGVCWWINPTSGQVKQFIRTSTCKCKTKFWRQLKAVYPFTQRIVKQKRFKMFSSFIFELVPHPTQYLLFFLLFHLVCISLRFLCRLAIDGEDVLNLAVGVLPQGWVVYKAHEGGKSVLLSQHGAVLPSCKSQKDQT